MEKSLSLLKIMNVQTFSVLIVSTKKVDQVMHNQMKQKQHHDIHCKQHQFKAGDTCTIYVKDFSEKESWLPGIIAKTQGPVTYLIELEDERVVR